VADATRASDAAFRFGGEEFVAVVRLAGTDDVQAVADRLCEAVSALRLPHPGNPPHGVVTVSVGATLVDRARLRDSDDAWLQRADSAMYLAKRRGRARAVTAVGDGPPVRKRAASG
jgi:diguanylate cyclase (GGDEF)-like protein